MQDYKQRLKNIRNDIVQLNFDIRETSIKNRQLDEKCYGLLDKFTELINDLSRKYFEVLYKIKFRRVLSFVEKEISEIEKYILFGFGIIHSLTQLSKIPTP